MGDFTRVPPIDQTMNEQLEDRQAATEEDDNGNTAAPCVICVDNVKTDRLGVGNRHRAGHFGLFGQRRRHISRVRIKVWSP